MFKTMAALIALLISLGVITSPEQVTKDHVTTYGCNIVADDLGGW